MLRRSIFFGLTLIALQIVSPIASAQDTTPKFGLPDDIAFAAELWQVLREARLVGPRSIVAQPYEGTDPHGVILMTFDSEVSVNGREAPVIVKKNYMGEDISIESVATNPNLFLGAITVMFRRELGYDTENQNWFWAKYLADGTLDKIQRAYNWLAASPRIQKMLAWAATLPHQATIMSSCTTASHH